VRLASHTDARAVAIVLLDEHLHRRPQSDQPLFAPAFMSSTF